MSSHVIDVNDIAKLNGISKKFSSASNAGNFKNAKCSFTSADIQKIGGTDALLRFIQGSIKNTTSSQWELYKKKNPEVVEGITKAEQKCSAYPCYTCIAAVASEVGLDYDTIAKIWDSAKSITPSGILAESPIKIKHKNHDNNYGLIFVDKNEEPLNRVPFFVLYRMMSQPQVMEHSSLQHYLDSLKEQPVAKPKVKTQSVFAYKEKSGSYYDNYSLDANCEMIHRTFYGKNTFTTWHGIGFSATVNYSSIMIKMDQVVPGFNIDQANYFFRRMMKHVPLAMRNQAWNKLKSKGEVVIISDGYSCELVESKTSSK